MSYYDKQLVLTGRASRRKFRHSMMRGVDLISLSPRPPHFEFGSVEGDWRAIGGDLRRAMRRIYAE